MSRVIFARQYPLPAYTGPQPVYRASFPWAGAVPCLVRKGPRGWETAPVTGHSLDDATFAACPVAEASSTRHGAVMAFDFYHNRLVTP